MQIKARIIEVGSTADNQPYITLTPNPDAGGVPRPIRVPVVGPAAQDELRALAKHLYKDVMVTFTPVEGGAIAIDLSQGSLTDNASELLRKMDEADEVQPGARMLAQLLYLAIAGDGHIVSALASVDAVIAAHRDQLNALTDAVKQLRADTANLKNDAANLKNDTTNLKTTVYGLEEQIIDRVFEEFQTQGGYRGTSTVIGSPVHAPGEAAALLMSTPEPGIDTQVTPTWVEPAIAALRDIATRDLTRDDIDDVILADADTPAHLAHYGLLRNDVWLLYRPKRPLSGEEATTLRDGAVAFIRACYAHLTREVRYAGHEPITVTPALYFQVHAFDLTSDGRDPTPARDGAVRFDLHNEYADLWLTYTEAMAYAPRPHDLLADEPNRSDPAWPPLEAIIEYLRPQSDEPVPTVCPRCNYSPLVNAEPDATLGCPACDYVWPAGRGMVRIWATWSGREVKVIREGEALVIDQIETPASTLHQQSLRALRDGQDAVDPVEALDRWAAENQIGAPDRDPAGAIDEAGVELATAEPPEPVDPTAGLPARAVEPPPPPAGDIEDEPNYWQDPNATSETAPIRTPSKNKRKRRR